MGGVISELPYLKKCTVVVDIAQRWVQRIMEYGVIIVADVKEIVREGEIS